MIVCSCNVLTDHDVRSTLSDERMPRTTGQVYGCLGCSAAMRAVRTYHPPDHGRGDGRGLRHGLHLLPATGAIAVEHCRQSG